MMLTTRQKLTLLFGNFLMWMDQITDLITGISYHKKCHIHWAWASFLFTLFPSVLMFIGSMVNGLVEIIYGGRKKSFFNTIFGFGGIILWALVLFWEKDFVVDVIGIIFLLLMFPFTIGYATYKEFTNSNDDIFNVAFIKAIKSLEVFFEAMPQIFLNIFIRMYLAPFDDESNTIFLTQIFSITTSYFSLVQGLSERFVIAYSGTKFPNMMDVVKAGLFVILPNLTLNFLIVLLMWIVFSLRFALWMKLIWHLSLF